MVLQLLFLVAEKKQSAESARHVTEMMTICWRSRAGGPSYRTRSCCEARTVLSSHRHSLARASRPFISITLGTFARCETSPDVMKTPYCIADILHLEAL